MYRMSINVAHSVNRRLARQNRDGKWQMTFVRKKYGPCTNKKELYEMVSKFYSICKTFLYLYIFSVTSLVV